MTYERGDHVMYRGQRCVVEGIRHGRWFGGEPRTELRITAVEDYPGQVRIVGWWVPTIVLTPAPPKQRQDRAMVAQAADLLRGGAR